MADEPMDQEVKEPYGLRCGRELMAHVKSAMPLHDNPHMKKLYRKLHGMLHKAVNEQYGGEHDLGEHFAGEPEPDDEMGEQAGQQAMPEKKPALDAASKKQLDDLLLMTKSLAERVDKLEPVSTEAPAPETQAA